MVRKQHMSFLAAVAVAVVAMFAAPSVSLGDFVVTYDMPGGSLVPTVTGDDAAAVVAQNGVRSGGFNPSGGGNLYIYSSTLPDLPESATLEDYRNATLDGNNYVSFTFGPASDPIAFDSLEVDCYVTQGSSPIYIAVQSSVGGFGSTNPTLSITPDHTTGTHNNPIPADRVTVDLSDSAFDNVISDITFRIYYYDDRYTTGGTYRMDNLVLGGSLPVPEPTSIALLGVGGLLAMKRRRSRRA